MESADDPMSQIPLKQGRRTFGEDPVGYARARPEHPDELYKRLTERCNLNSGSVVFEVGPGVGLATRQLLKLAVAVIYAIEPDPRLVTFLRQSISCSALRIEESSFEDTNLPAAHFDLGIAATSFHWVEQNAGLAKARQVLRPGGWWAMWWNHFGSDKEDDAFQSATDHLFINMPDSPSLGRDGAHLSL
jgi:SAM-dependent methyltransferase